MKRISVLFFIVSGIIFSSALVEISDGRSQKPACKCVTDALSDIETIKD